MKAHPIGPVGEPHLLRWHLLPKNCTFNVWLHKIIRHDAHGSLHTHPSWNISIPLIGWYIEHVPLRPKEWPQVPHIQLVKVRWPKFRRASDPHRITLPMYPSPLGWEIRPCWSLFISGSAYKPWGFWVNGKLVEWKKFFVEHGRREAQELPTWFGK